MIPFLGKMFYSDTAQCLNSIQLFLFQLLQKIKAKRGPCKLILCHFSFFKLPFHPRHWIGENHFSYVPNLSHIVKYIHNQLDGKKSGRSGRGASCLRICVPRTMPSMSTTLSSRRSSRTISRQKHDN